MLDNTERLLARPFAQQKYEAWLDLCNKHGKPSTFTTGDFGFAWSAFRDAMIAGGPFTRSNDAAVIAHKQWRRKKKLIADRTRQILARAATRKIWQAAHLLPDRTFFDAADEGRSERAAGLIDLRRNGRAPRSVAKMEDAGCLITANAWFASAILGESQLPVNPGSIARWLIEKDRNEGYSYEMLRDRLRRDLKRIEMLDVDTAWSAFGHRSILTARDLPTTADRVRDLACPPQNRSSPNLKRKGYLIHLHLIIWVSTV